MSGLMYPPVHYFVHIPPYTPPYIERLTRLHQACTIARSLCLQNRTGASRCGFLKRTTEAVLLMAEAGMQILMTPSLPSKGEKAGRSIRQHLGRARSVERAF